MNYKNAFKCHKCPERDDSTGCPMWWEFMQANVQTGDERLQKQCGYQAMPVFLVEVIKASNRPASEISSMKTTMIETLNQAVNGRIIKHEKG